MRLSNQLAIRRSTRLIAALPFRRSREIRIPRPARFPHSRDNAGERGGAAALYFTHVARILVLLVAAFVAAALITPALSRVAVQHARYAAGTLEVHGKTVRPHLSVALDGRYFTRSDAAARFRFRVHYLPNDCTIRLHSGGRSRIAFITGCLPR